MEKFQADGILFTDKKETTIHIDDVEDIKNVFNGCKVHTIHASKHLKLYYIMEDIQENGVAHIIYGEEGNDYLPNRVLCVFCNETQPITMTEEARQEFRTLLGV